jgi:hypothetical protein
MGTQPRQGFERVEPKKKEISWRDPVCGCERSPDVARDVPCPQHEYIEPSNEQLANFVCVRIWGPGFGNIHKRIAMTMFEDDPDVRAGWLVVHREFQRALWRIGDGNS